MKSIFRVLYLYVISAITLSMIVGGVIAMATSFSKYLFPEYEYTTANNSNEKITDNTYDDYYDDYSYDKDDVKTNEAKQHNDQIATIKAVLTSFAVVVVSTPLYIYHWGKIESERKEMEE